LIVWRIPTADGKHCHGFVFCLRETPQWDYSAHISLPGKPRAKKSVLLHAWFCFCFHPSLAHFTLSTPQFNDIQASFNRIESDNPPNRPRPILPEATDRHQPASASATGQALRDLGYPSISFGELEEAVGRDGRKHTSRPHQLPTYSGVEFALESVSRIWKYTIVQV
jgi:hypothetical protein